MFVYFILLNHSNQSLYYVTMYDFVVIILDCSSFTGAFDWQNKIIVYCLLNTQEIGIIPMAVMKDTQ